MNSYLIILVQHGRYIAMQFLDAETLKEAETEAHRVINPFSGAWAEVIEVKNNA